MRLIAVGLPIVATIGLGQSVQPTRYPITEASVAKLLQTSGVDVTSSYVHLPMKLTAKSSDPHLQIVATQRVMDGEVRLQLRCRVAGDCLPFDAIVDTGNRGAIIADIKQRANSNYPVPSSNHSTIAALGLRTVEGTQAFVRAGLRVLLVIQGGKMEIHLPVIAIDSGSKGTVVRVCSVDRKKTFRAMVVDSSTVRGLVE